MATVVNDIHGQLNRTTVARIAQPDSLDALRRLLDRAQRENQSVALCGGRHAMGGQQFATDGLLVDTRRLNQVREFDDAQGTITVGAGIQWPELIRWLLKAQEGTRGQTWSIAQKQTGADRMSLGGSLSANTHGRGLAMPPLVGDIESFTLMDAAGDLRRCSREENPELFALAIGGYGMLGIVTEVTLRLAPRRLLERVVKVIEVDEVMDAFAERISQGYLFGDFQYMTDERSEGYFRRGVFSCYRPVSDSDQGKTPAAPKQLSRNRWAELLYSAHFNKAHAFQVYADYYLSTNGDRYWSDTHQLTAYIDDYHHDIDRRRGAADPASEVITEIFVPRDRLVDFLEEVSADFRANAVNVIYGTVRLVEPDTETFLPWARQAYVGVIFNLHTVHTPEGIDHSARAFRRLIDYGIARGGSYYLTYHRFATRAQVEACYPHFSDYLRLKRIYDPQERFQSDWYRHYKSLFETGDT
ncbi:MAG: FAD-binding oxidoreductase [Armatimonas sp.]